jgi:hypothetical protein
VNFVLVRATWIGAIGFSLFQSSVCAAPQSAPQLRLPPMTKAPVIDGTIGAAEWAGANRMERFGDGPSLSSHQASFWVGADADNLYIAVRSETPPQGQLVRKAVPLPGDIDARPFEDDALEIFVCPNPDAPRAEQNVYQAVINANGAIYDQLYTAQGGQAWRGGWKVNNSVRDDYWEAEIALPWKDLGIAGLPMDKAIGLRVCRDWQRSIGPVQTEWSPLGGAYIAVSTMARVTWDAKAPVVQVRQLQNAPGQPVNVRLAISNPTNQPLQTLVRMTHVPPNSAATRIEKIVEVAAGGEQELNVQSAALHDEPIDTQISVTSPDAGTVYYARDFRWKINRPESIWNLTPEAAQKVNTQFAYFPSFNALHALVDVADLPQHDSVTAVRLAIRKKGSSQVLAQTTMPPLKNNISELKQWRIPALSAGTYELVTTFQGTNSLPQVQEFPRNAFPWEGNKLGLSDIVVSPFTPIRVARNEVETVLRKHRVNGAGLWDQVVADKKPLLKAPMRLEATINGKRVTAQGKLTLTSHKATQATTQAVWQAGALKGRTQSIWDYDGVMKTTFTLEPATQKVDSLTLVIPLDDALMPLMHACTDGIRINYAGKIPAGQGAVWNSIKAARSSIIGNYVPYIWVGAQERGLSVFGDNDAGWIMDDKTPCQEIVRRADGTLELRLRLIQSPTSWKQPRKITLGFQATPIKPMPKDWRLWTVGARGKVDVPGQYRQGFFGSGYYWGTQSPYADLAPRNEDFSLYTEFEKTRQTGKIAPDFMARWLKGYAILRGEKGALLRTTYKDHIETAFSMLSTKPQGVLVYTNSKGARYDLPEGQTFFNEWNRTPFPDRQKDYSVGGDYRMVGGYYEVDPLASYRDYSAWYWKKLLTSFSDGIYWDNGFLQSSFNPISSAAYVRADGQVQPASGIWNIRALVRRGAILSSELKRPNRNMVHMTNTAITPILSFAGSILSWEDGAGDSDFQDRFSRELIQTTDIGRQFGTMPVALSLDQIHAKDAEQADWLGRTAAGVLLTHEIKTYSRRASPDHYFDNYDRLLEFGYGQQDVKIFNYWQSGYPVQLSGDTSSIVVSKPGQVLLIVCDWGGGGDIQVKLDRKALALNGALKATDAESGQPLPMADNVISFTLKKHDFKVILINTQ